MTTPSAERHPSISITNYRFAEGDTNPKPAARIACDFCDTDEHVPLTGPFNGYHVAERFRRKGWEIGRKTRCPECLKSRRHHRRENGDSKLGAQLRLVQASPIDRASPVAIAAATGPVDLAPMPPPPPAPRVILTAHPSTPSAPESAPMNSASPAPSKVRDLTPEERAKVRRELDAHFDDSVGMYLGGENDQRIGERLGLPWAAVAQMREAAYGPIRTDPEVEAMRAAVKAVSAALEERNRGVENAMKEDRANLKAALAEGERNAKEWRQAMETRIEQSAAQFREAMAEMRLQVSKIQDTVERAARNRGLKV